MCRDIKHSVFVNMERLCYVDGGREWGVGRRERGKRERERERERGGGGREVERNSFHLPKHSSIEHSCRNKISDVALHARRQQREKFEGKMMEEKRH